MSEKDGIKEIIKVLNLIINGIPSIQNNDSYKRKSYEGKVLNLIINGIPSILSWKRKLVTNTTSICFKPYYKWNTFNTWKVSHKFTAYDHSFSFKPYYKWNTFNTRRQYRMSPQLNEF